jgi:hypothetical protein
LGGPSGKASFSAHPGGKPQGIQDLGFWIFWILDTARERTFHGSFRQYVQ